ncbi:MAG: DUF362 domain-containing protein [Bryobacteraceae bacterium]|nr:DUF362 domain-containing protein [Bryobacteraceae bacterium]
MAMDVTRRNLLRFGAGALVGSPFASGLAQVSGYSERARVSLIHGDDRRKIVYESLKAIEDQVRPRLRTKKYVVIKPNNVSTRNQLAATHLDALRGILDFLEPYKKPVVIAESSAGPTREGYENFHYTRLASEYKWAKVNLVDLNEEARYEVAHILDANLHPVPVRLAKRLFDPDAYIICSAVMKTHNTVIATLSVKNMTLGAPLHQAPSEKQRWNDKRHYHGGVRQTHYGMMLTAQKMAPFWGATVVDGFEGMEGNGPASGTPVDSRVSIASTDYIAADRIAVEAMGIDPAWLGYLLFCNQVGVGQYDRAKIDVIGEDVAKVTKKYALHKDIERELQWMGEMTEVPPKLG